MSTRAPGAPPTTVVVAIVADDAEGLPATVAAVRSQVYETARVAVLGGSRRSRDEAAAEAVEWVSTLGSFLSSLDRSVSYVWLVYAGSQPRPDALGALVRDAERSGASLAGSKLLRRSDPSVLVSVGLATDVFDATYVGIDPDEVDQGQYDVVRDVAAVPGASMLARRDLLAGLGGIDPKLAPEAAAIDLCQRARLRGARIITSPASEVLYPAASRRGKDWHEDASRMRAMAKVYAPLTLLWSIPLLFLVGLVESVVSPFLGRWKIFDWLRAWGWNLIVLPSTLRGRFAARRGRVAGDAELFRYQVRGSARLRALFVEAGARIEQRLPGDYTSVSDLGRELRRPAFVVGALAVGFVAMATRDVWRGGLPSVAYSLPLPASGTDAVLAYAGGWNPGGFGGSDPLPPFVGFAGLVQTVLFDRPGLVMAVIVVGAVLSGVWGMTRLMRTWGVGVIPGVLAGVVLMAGPASRAIADSADVPTLTALGVVPWVIRVALARIPERWPARVGRVAAVAWLVGLVGVLSPALFALPVVAVVLWAVLGLTNRRAWRSAASIVIASAAGVWLMLPWVVHADLGAFLRSGAAFWEPDTVLGTAVVLVAAAAMVAASGRLGLLAGWGAVLIGVGAIGARSSDLGGGRQLELGGLAMIALGSAIVVAVAFELVSQWEPLRMALRPFAVVAIALAGLLVVASLGVLIAGRVGLPADELGEALEFVAVAGDDAELSRALLFGAPESLPGESRSLRGLNYRVVSLPAPTMWEAWLPAPGVADMEFEALLNDLFDGGTSRVGRDLASFGVRWVVVMDDTPLEAVFEGQLDLVPLRGLDRLTYAVDAEAPVRALATTGAVWEPAANSYRGEPDPDARVFLADNANSRWGPDWQQVSFGNEVSAGAGEARYRRNGTRSTQAVVAGVLAFGLLAMSWVGRRFR